MQSPLVRWPLIQAPMLGAHGTIAFVLVCVVILIAVFARAAAARPASQIHKRGALLRDSSPRLRRRRRSGAGKWLTLANIPVPPMDETKHFKLIGATGTGKSTAIRELLAGAIARGDRAVVADPDGGYARHLLDRHRGDLLLNPFDPHSAKWDLFAELHNRYDVEQLVSALIPDTDDPASREWRGYARTFVSSVMRACQRRGRCDIDDLRHLLMVAEATELRDLVAGSPAQPFLDPDNARMFASIRAVTGSSVAAFEYISAQRSQAFSVRRWVAQEGRGLLFIPYAANQIAALRTLIAAWLRLAIFEALSQPPERDQRLWFVIDELDALGAIAGLKDALARLRKFGCRCVLGFQAIAQVSSTYGAGEAQTIVENCGNTLILRCSASENGGTSQFASRLIGEREVIRRQVSRGRDRESSFSSRGGRRSRQITEQHVTEVAVLPSQLEQLPDFSGYLKRASSGEWLRVQFRPRRFRG